MTKSPGDLRSDVADWVDKAEQDWIAVGSLDASVIPTVICFHCQQCAEKYLKALLTLHDQVPRRTHDLGVLLDGALEEEPELSGVSGELLLLDRYAVSIRYPGPDADEQEAVTATAAAAIVRDTCRRLLGFGDTEDHGDRHDPDMKDEHGRHANEDQAEYDTNGAERADQS